MDNEQLRTEVKRLRDLKISVPEIQKILKLSRSKVYRLMDESYEQRNRDACRERKQRKGESLPEVTATCPVCNYGFVRERVDQKHCGWWICAKLWAGMERTRKKWGLESW